MTSEQRPEGRLWEGLETKWFRQKDRAVRWVRGLVCTRNSGKVSDGAEGARWRPIGSNVGNDVGSLTSYLMTRTFNCIVNGEQLERPVQENATPEWTCLDRSWNSSQTGWCLSWDGEWCGQVGTPGTVLSQCLVLMQELEALAKLKGRRGCHRGKSDLDRAQGPPRARSVLVARGC